MHQYSEIDYSTMHAWPKNWSWFGPKHPESTFDVSIDKIREYASIHREFAKKLNKPIALSEFGFPRNGESLSPESSVSLRKRFLQSTLDLLVESKLNNGEFAGLNFWVYGGLGNADSDNDGVWGKG